MAGSNVVHTNDCGLPFNGIEWLEKHHQSKAHEREQMIRDLRIERGLSGPRERYRRIQVFRSADELHGRQVGPGIRSAARRSHGGPPRDRVRAAARTPGGGRCRFGAVGFTG